MQLIVWCAVPDVLDGDACGWEEALDLPAPGLVVAEHPLARVLERRLGPRQVGGEVVVRIVEQQVVVDELLARDDAEEVDEALGVVPHDAGDVGAAGVRLEDGEVDVGVGVGGVVEAAARHGVGRGPEAEDAVDVEEVVEEGAVLVPALAGAGGAEDGGEPRQRRVHRGLLAAQERARRGQGVLQGSPRRRRHGQCGGLLGRVRWHGDGDGGL
ncbi:unnamed protein product [Urochloa decumbens]|uniref:Uncharacterized protein n=1 Tax=Urochloa decumbens TaxID=240449 RepID=A0ABC9CIC7_9POAL